MELSSRTPDEAPPAEDFLRSVLRSGLLTREQLQDALRAVPRAQRTDSLALADHLVRTGKLTRFQASKLLRGIAQGMVLGPFRVLAPLGQGGMGKVYLVRDTRSDMLVALKILPPRMARESDKLLARFRREMELNQKVAHPHLCWTYEVGEWRGVPYIAMEYIPGKTLSRIVNEDGPLPLPRAARLMAEVASALDHAHGEGLVHRDLKPSNILITPRDHAKVLDLGLAIIHGEEVDDPTVIGGKGHIVGSMDYIAPEQTYDAASVDRRSDIYSMGCTLYMALSRQPPFPGGTSRDKILRHRSDIPTSLGELVPCLPKRFVQFVEQMMDKDPTRRPETAIDVEREMRYWAEEEEMPFDTVTELDFDESAIIKGGGSPSEYSKVSLPDVEEAGPPRDDSSLEFAVPGWSLSPRALLWLIVGGGLLVVALALLLFAVKA